MICISIIQSRASLINNTQKYDFSLMTLLKLMCDMKYYYSYLCDYFMSYCFNNNEQLVSWICTYKIFLHLIGHFTSLHGKRESVMQLYIRFGIRLVVIILLQVDACAGECIAYFHFIACTFPTETNFSLAN